MIRICQCCRLVAADDAPTCRACGFGDLMPLAEPPPPPAAPAAAPTDDHETPARTRRANR